MLILAINGSPRPEGNTAGMLNTVLAVCAAAGHETELYQAGGRQVRGCCACGGCSPKRSPGRCAIDDWINELYPKMKAADAIVIGSPTYFSDLTPETKALIDRCGFMSRRDGNPFSRKIGAAVSAVRRAGAVHTLDSIGHFFGICDMIVPGSTYWNMSLSMGPGDYEKDEEGVRTMQRLGENIVWLLEKIHG
ncbi:MAG: flavodoxin family protein [Defluviitaleaceae bacterium]|nr:flavodoxin family protein [Defluviitaleaceae bacterium]MCL2239786.1 flavodoxin family protein [Defluviitaleaceae bacterium]